MSRFLPPFWWQESNIYVVFSIFIYRPTSLLASIKVPVFLFIVSMLSLSVDSRHQHRPEADVSHLISVPLGFSGPSKWLILKQSKKAVAIKHLLVLDHFG
jgi:hypothetical protein